MDTGYPLRHSWSSLPARLCRHPMDLPRESIIGGMTKRGGLAAWLKSGSACENSIQHLSFLWGDQLHGCGVGMDFLESQFQWPHIIITASSSRQHRGLYHHDHCGRVNLCNLWPLCRATQPECDSSLLKMVLICAHSLVNKTFILNNFFYCTSFWILDFLCATETWINPGKLCSLALNTLTLSSRGGGIVTVFKNAFPCRSLSTALYSGFKKHCHYCFGVMSTQTQHCISSLITCLYVFSVPYLGQTQPMERMSHIFITHSGVKFIAAYHEVWESILHNLDTNKHLTI